MSGHIPVHLHVNGRAYELLLDPRVTLLDCLREHLALTGPKKGCDQGACGACTVLADGERINACLTPAVQCDGMEILTVEAMAGHELGAEVQAAFLAHDGFQCGYCTSGQICSIVAMLAEHLDGRPSAVTEDLAGPAALTDAEIRERMAGNLCRCGAYNGIVAAIREVAGA
ncbi:2Fe-2S iron-sulfur cluster-binding protein [Nonomuraea sp. H19]|uniref:2Fe-2S iron-sulfur cluster-binding protein n=1 Tax=Nonomuraea sp. H19 TaxID=3452206 RepID=UPI003F896611